MIPYLTVSRAREVIARIQAYRRAITDFEQYAGDDRVLLGDLYAGPATDTMRVRQALDWTSSVRQDDWPLPSEAGAAVLESRPDPDLSHVHDTWRDALWTPRWNTT